jgi:hypothetical protein
MIKDWYKFNEQFSWKELIPESLTLKKGNVTVTYQKGNVVQNSEMINLMYSQEGADVPTDMQIDIYFENIAQYDVNETLKLSVDFALGDLMTSEFTIENGKVSVVEYTSTGSKFDPSNTIFGLEEKSLQDFIRLLNRLSKSKLKREDFNFLDTK